MPIYELKDNRIEVLKETSFREQGLKERQDLQRLLQDQIQVVDPDVMVLAEEFGRWDNSKRRIDLLGLDRDARLVVIELKRTEDGGHMELQALRYAAMVSRMTFEQAVEVYARHLTAKGKETDAEKDILGFLGWEEANEERFGQDVRIVLVSGDFSKELTTSVLWLNERELDVRCVRMKPYVNDGRVLVDVQQVIPLPESGEYVVQVRENFREGPDGGQGGLEFMGEFSVELLPETVHRQDAVHLPLEMVGHRPGAVALDLQTGVGFQDIDLLQRELPGDAPQGPVQLFHLLCAGLQVLEIQEELILGGDLFRESAGHYLLEAAEVGQAFFGESHVQGDLVGSFQVFRHVGKELGELLDQGAGRNQVPQGEGQGDHHSLGMVLAVVVQEEGAGPETPFPQERVLFHGLPLFQGLPPGPPEVLHDEGPFRLRVEDPAQEPEIVAGEEGGPLGKEQGGNPGFVFQEEDP